LFRIQYYDQESVKSYHPMENCNSKEIGAIIHWGRIVPNSLLRASIDNNIRSFNHNDTWTEWSANRFSYEYVNKPTDWNKYLNNEIASIFDINSTCFTCWSM
jgi:hypothetical protein